jgi:hypothetical protein
MSVTRQQLPQVQLNWSSRRKVGLKAKILILDGIKDHVVPHLSGKAEAKDMWKALSDLYQNKNENRVMALRKQLCGTKMAKGEGVKHRLGMN